MIDNNTPARSMRLRLQNVNLLSRKCSTYIKYHKAKKRAEEDPNALYANDPNAKIRTPNGEWVLASELNKGKYRPPYTPKELDW